MPQKLLLADDSVTIQRVIELTFADEDIQVIAVGDGQQAITRIESERPDVILADVGMPERDGYEVASFVKRTPHLAHIPVLLLTGAFEPVDEARARAAGCDGVLVKPFEPQMVINRVRDLLAGRRPDSLWATPPPQPEHRSSPGLPASKPSEPASYDPKLSPPEAAGAPADSLDDYFDRLDAAFSGLTSPEPAEPKAPSLDVPPASPPAPPPPPLAAPASQIGGGALAADAFDGLEPGPLQVIDDGLGGWDPGLSGAEPLPAKPSGDAPAGAGALRTPGAGPELPAGATPTQASPTALPSLSDAFAALLSVEQRYAAAPREAPISASVPAPAPAAAPPALTDETLELIVKRVIERLTTDAVRDTVLDVAERLVREEIARIKNAAR